MVRVKNLVIGDGMPKICVPVMGKTEREILQNAVLAAGSVPDLVEFRCDDYEGVTDLVRLKQALDSMRECIGELPLIMTFRSKEEGGVREADDREYLRICRQGIHSGRIDLLDIELRRYERGMKAEKILEEARLEGIPVIMSLHHFSHTPGEEEMLKELQRMKETGADILKLAVMAQNRLDVLALLGATVRMSQMTEKPIVTMAMGETGKISRIIGAFSGSAITFASAGQASAPGQIEVEKMRKILQNLPL